MVLETNKQGIRHWQRWTQTHLHNLTFSDSWLWNPIFNPSPMTWNYDMMSSEISQVNLYSQSVNKSPAIHVEGRRNIITGFHTSFLLGKYIGVHDLYCNHYFLGPIWLHWIWNQFPNVDLLFTHRSCLITLKLSWIWNRFGSPDSLCYQASFTGTGSRQQSQSRPS